MSFATLEKTVSHSEYEMFKNDALRKQFFKKVMPLSQIEFLDDTHITLDSTGDNKMPVRISKGAISQLVNTLGIPKQMLSKMDTLLGADKTKTFVNQMKTAISSFSTNGNSAKGVRADVTLTLNPETKSIVGVNAGANTLATETFFTMFEDFMTNHPNIEIRSMSISESGQIEINTVNSEWMFELEGMIDENYLPGFTFTNGDGTMIRPFSLRLVCTNGMVGMRHDTGIQLMGDTSKHVEKFFYQVQNMDSEKDMLKFRTDFDARVRLMSETFASYHELLNAYHKVKNASKTNDPQKLEMLNAVFGIDHVNRAYTRAGIVINNLTDRHQKNCATDILVWDLLNIVTDYASHDYGYNMDQADCASLMKWAGTFAFKPEYDLAYIIQTPKFS